MTRCPSDASTRPTWAGSVARSGAFSAAITLAFLWRSEPVLSLRRGRRKLCSIASSTYLSSFMARSPSGTGTPELVELWPDWRHHVFLTDLDGDVVKVDRFHREHATGDQRLEGMRRSRAPAVGWISGRTRRGFRSRSWHTTRCVGPPLFGGHDTDRMFVACTNRARILARPGRLVNRAGQRTLRLPSRWPWANTVTTILDALRSIEPVST